MWYHLDICLHNFRCFESLQAVDSLFVNFINDIIQETQNFFSFWS